MSPKWKYVANLDLDGTHPFVALPLIAPGNSYIHTYSTRCKNQLLVIEHGPRLPLISMSCCLLAHAMASGHTPSLTAVTSETVCVD